MSSETQLNILLVDDQQNNLIALSEVLAKEDRNLILAESGNEALRLALEHDLAAIILDVMMPDMDGFEVAVLLRGNQKTRDIPIIFVTAMHHEGNLVHEGKTVNDVDYLLKPLDMDLIRSRVNDLCERKLNVLRQPL